MPLTFPDPPTPEPPVMHEIHRSTGNRVPSSYIVILNDGVDMDGFIQILERGVDSSAFELVERFTVVHGFSGIFNDAALKFVQTAIDVRRIEEDAVLDWTAKVEQDGVPWALNRISQPAPLVYTFDDSIRDAVPVRVYVIDSGIYAEHWDLKYSSATVVHGYSVTSGPDRHKDTVGHGTAMASIIGGTQTGVYKYAHLIAVKVGDDDPTITSLVRGINWVFIEEAKVPANLRRPAVANISMTLYDPNREMTIVDAAVQRLIATGVHVCTGAGNNNRDAAHYTPARVASVNTVGAMNVVNARWSDSNWGPNVSFFAPGEMVRVPAVTGEGAMTCLSGTSLAAAHVSGLIAYLLALHPNNPELRTPADVTRYLKNKSLEGMLIDIPDGTPNLLVSNIHFDDPKPPAPADGTQPSEDSNSPEGRLSNNPQGNGPNLLESNVNL